ncbi:hypothetical protein D9756_002260 [Leucocoprinus leucothites]|uniref:Transfer RNA methyltransferase 82 n=1 Tax=Leucocoprinus leucothites TaxID=201217 RepID=A0A8H5GBT3_9AGAR|nr:hypothetical protein D9756_002260 [Leucoagaricus leucothites]
MTALAYSRLFIGSERIIAVLGGHFFVLDSTYVLHPFQGLLSHLGNVIDETRTGEVISKCSLSDSTTEGKSKSKGPIVAAAVNEHTTHLLTVGENKMLSVWELPGLTLVNERELPKRPTGLAFTKDSQTIIVSDKFGDVFSYPFDFVAPEIKPTRDEYSSHENPSGGQLVLGHASPLNAFLLSQDEKYIITADRDEHIRVSWYPRGYNIEMYCLGHRRYVSAIHIPLFARDALISGGGDPSLKIWDWMSGQCTGEIQIWEAVEPFIAVKSDKRRRSEEDDDEGGATQKRKGKGKKSKKRANKKAAQVKKDIEDDGEGEDPQKELRTTKRRWKKGRHDSYYSPQLALFGFQYPAGPIEHFDFGHPVIDFTLDTSARVWVSLDTNKSTPGAELRSDVISVGLVEFNEIGKLVEITEEQPLLKSLNEKAVKDTKEKTLDFYIDLKGMPKWSEPSMQAAAGEGEDDATESISSNPASKSLPRRKEARMKNKRNVLAKMQEVQNEHNAEKGKPGTVRSIEDVESEDVEGRREAKRAKSGVDIGV